MALLPQDELARPYTACFTGHRQLSEHELPALVMRVEQVLDKLYRLGYRRFICGGALGFDMLAAAVVCRLRDSELSDISLHLLLPCHGQDARWSEPERARYAEMLRLADSYHYVSQEYSREAMSLRNRALVTAADLCIAYMTNPASGTGGTVSMARRRGIPIRNLADLL